MANNTNDKTDNAPTTTRRTFGKKAYMVPAILAAIKATETVATAQAPMPMVMT